MKNLFLATAALSLPTASRAFLAAAKKSSPVRASSGSLFQQEEYYDLAEQYFGQDGGQNYEQGQNQQQQFHDQNYAQDPQQQQYQQHQYQQQQQYYDQQQHQQGMDPNIYGQGPGQGGQQEPSLLITENVEDEMARATAGFEVGGVDYLALARQRAEARVESNNSESSDADWHQLALETKKRQEMEEASDGDWESSQDEGSAGDGAALGMGVKLEQYGKGNAMVTEGGLVVDGSGEQEGGPQLLL